MKRMEINELRERLKSIGNQDAAEHSKKYLKSPYSFYGIKVPELRKIAKEFSNLDICDAYNIFDELWNSGNHEEMEIAIFILQNQKKNFSEETWRFILQRIGKAKTWDHIDAISSWILGEILSNNLGFAAEIKEMALSKNPWERRASIVSTMQIIKKGKLDLTYLLAEKLVYDDDIYVQKGAGWMLRECGKKQRISTKEFILMHLDMKNYAFSYATERMKELREIRKARSKMKGKNE